MPKVNNIVNKSQVTKTYLERKQQAVIRDFESSHAWYQNVLDRINNSRSVVVTLMLAYIGYLFTVNVQDPAKALPLIVIPVPFLVIEIYARAHTSFIRAELAEIEKIFMLENDDEFYNKIQSFVLRDARVGKEILSTTWIKHVILGQLTVDAVVWYAFIILTAIISYNYFVH